MSDIEVIRELMKNFDLTRKRVQVMFPNADEAEVVKMTSEIIKESLGIK